MNTITQNISSISMIPKKTFSTSDLEPFERRKQAALSKVQAKLDKAQRLYQSAHSSVEQNISEFLRITTLPGLLNQSKISNAAFDKRIRTLQETKKELERKIAHYQSDLLRIHAGDIPHQYSSSKDILHNIKSKVSNSNNTMKLRSSNDISSTSINEALTPCEHPESDLTPSAKNSVNLSLHSTTGPTLEVVRSSPSNSISNEIGHLPSHMNSSCKLLFIVDSHRQIDIDLSSRRLHSWQ
jgi:hypothetical protein